MSFFCISIPSSWRFRSDRSTPPANLNENQLNYNAIKAYLPSAPLSPSTQYAFLIVRESYVSFYINPADRLYQLTSDLGGSHFELLIGRLVGPDEFLGRKFDIVFRGEVAHGNEQGQPMMARNRAFRTWQSSLGTRVESLLGIVREGITEEEIESEGVY
jgi:hypothetical protein